MGGESCVGIDREHGEDLRGSSLHFVTRHDLWLLAPFVEMREKGELYIDVSER